ncbi:MOSC domain-containing protein [Ponticoccus sp. SC2-23]|uniref:MOSC domain-containing protein n=1 Tax=Alexandriicola marinus TaxID=2081710 RepID=UPI000FDA61EE|nr:MOSC domain-containing protein [Alexandriicola marinus]MBM1219139.1 MOSC domain-containing protein [Ponticoccus sp. SC6-9]MBM1223789.1 MOSC domain-containing protein [Ponticoccus sp. SC6-15]MBM1228953.1 MOSC domain-containing protein [Ponticoccus sp. SC6-38]MBM1232755.1 MOSC domain-containing protein [Ponticoccus sp. SC6-45]MBM1237295.1 MOSC domain-containing protein [Ponticoccus sp. SC6-49]MBM1241766.1 MOSC domain-containing protein [Ponticoccus sp. SC2-64]MBM1246279.1 MOSC domain-contai
MDARLTIRAVLTGAAEPIDTKSGWTGFFKRPRKGVVEIGPRGLEGDTIVDTDNHGGPDQAVYLMGSGDYAHWARCLGRDLPPGSFGENIVIDGWTSATAAIGDRIAIGDVLLELTAPRIPCITLARVMDDPGFVKRFFDEGHSGAYARVLSPGPVRAGDAARLLPYADGPEVTMAACLAASRTGLTDPAILAALARIPAHRLLVRAGRDASATP